MRRWGDSGGLDISNVFIRAPSSAVCAGGNGLAATIDRHSSWGIKVQMWVRILKLAVTGLVFLPCAAMADAKYVISSEVWGYYDEYLGRIDNGNKPGAFAITKDGTGAPAPSMSGAARRAAWPARATARTPSITASANTIPIA
jgi:hypothetical protein